MSHSRSHNHPHIIYFIHLKVWPYSINIVCVLGGPRLHSTYQEERTTRSRTIGEREFRSKLDSSTSNPIATSSLTLFVVSGSLDWSRRWNKTHSLIAVPKTTTISLFFLLNPTTPRVHKHIQISRVRTRDWAT